MIEEYYFKEENCFRDLGQARQLFRTNTTTKSKWNNMMKGLGLMYFYCPEELTDLVEYTMNEAFHRELYMNIVDEDI